ncbi:PcfJ domain-containing protein [Escherichia coli]|uniref:PcfJ domain-containing protein n=1 Tax=Escherichia coli TaxID=562 RepID=UPI000BE17274|nr:PcfJ domain-containing protein [Escherichia coli]HAL6370037.1 cytoplasmic protein [Escherichia coli]
MTGNIHQNYNARDVINAPEVKTAILQRSLFRQDNETIQKWLLNHFYRWLISDFPMVQQINSLAEYSLFNKNDDVIPEWLVSKFNTASVSTATLYYIETDHQQILTKERELVEFLSRKCGTRLESKLQRITCYVAFRMREEEHEKMLQRREKGWQPSEQNTVKSILDVPDGKIVEFDASHSNFRREMAYESWHMQHCVGQFDDRKNLTGGYGEYYANQIEQHKLRLFSLRDNNNIPHVTIALNVVGDSLEIDQIKGKQNRHPVKKYADDVLSLLQLLSPQAVRHSDCEGMGIVYENTPEYQGWKYVTEVYETSFLLSVLHNNFHLLEHFTNPSVELQWLLLHSAPDKLHYLNAIDPIVATSAKMLFPGAEWHPQFAGQNISNISFEIESLTLQTSHYLPLSEVEK